MHTGVDEEQVCLEEGKKSRWVLRSCNQKRWESSNSEDPREGERGLRLREGNR